jgi:hypothetical protein
MPMTRPVKFVLSLLPLVILLMSQGGCSCGFDCNNDRGSNKPAVLNLGFSDESVDQLKQVVIEVDSIILRRTGAEDVVVDTFTIRELGLTDEDSFQLNLLQYQGLGQLLVITGLELKSASYAELRLTILDGDINRSYVQESDDEMKQLNVAGGVLVLPGPSVAAGEQQFTVAFSLAQALLYRQPTDDYLLTTEGIRVMNNATAASVSGRVDSSLFDTVAPCNAKPDPEAGNRIYLYRDRSLPPEDLADVFTSGSTSEVPAAARAPYAVAAVNEDPLTGSLQYALGFLAAGDYTLAFSCNAAEDDPVNYDGIVIPLPSGQIYEIQLSEGEKATCDLVENGNCN